MKSKKKQGWLPTLVDILVGTGARSSLIYNLILIDLKNSAVKKNEQQVQHTTLRLTVSLPLSRQFFLETRVS